MFGELYFLLEYRDESISLQYSPDEEFTLPQNLFIIGTMNTADRSIARIDAALRRRFSFVELDPRIPPVQGLLARWLFEQFVTVALREAITARFGGRVEGQIRYYLDQAGQVPLWPDIVWKVGGTTAAVIDAKYKAEKPAGYPNADLYQLLAYCTILGLPVGHLVYARGTPHRRGTSSVSPASRSSATPSTSASRRDS